MAYQLAYRPMNVKTLPAKNQGAAWVPINKKEKRKPGIRVIELEWPREDSAVSAKGKGTGVVRGAGYDAMKGSGMNFVFFKYA